MSDLDAENIYRIVIQGNDLMTAMNTYYSRIANSLTRADIFLSHISYSTVKEKILDELIYKKNEQGDLETIKEKYPDTYNFLMSLNDHRATIAEY